MSWPFRRGEETPSQPERLQILKMLGEGKISAEEADRLLSAMDPKAVQPEAVQTGPSPKWLRVRVYEGDKSKVNVNIPISLAKVAMKFVPNVDVNGQKIDLDEIVRAIAQGAHGKLVEVEDGAERVEVYVE